MATCSIPGCEKQSYAFNLCPAHYTRMRRHGSPTGGRTSPGEPLAWLLAHKEYIGDDCLQWPYARARGYGILSIDGRQRVASNYLCELLHGSAPEGADDAAHSCGNGQHGCVNPRHIRWATRAENHSDMYRHEVRPLGQRTGLAKVSEEDVRQIRLLKSRGMRAEEIASQFGISRSNVYLITTRKKWRWVE